MPTYDYSCQRCNHRFEIFQSMTAKVLRTCPECGQKSLKRLFGPGAGILFKGSGFYTTDYRSKDYQARAKQDSSEGSKSPSGEGSKSSTSEGSSSSDGKKKDSAKKKTGS